MRPDCASCQQPFSAHGAPHSWDLAELPSCPAPSLTGTYRAEAAPMTENDLEWLETMMAMPGDRDGRFDNDHALRRRNVELLIASYRALLARAPVVVSPSRESGSLTFAMLRAANTARLPLFRNRKGEPAHSEPDGSDWSLGDWSNAVLGELGEAANLIKKIQRGDRTLDGAREELAKEFADVVTYLDILAFRAGVDLGAATAEKWDEVSARVGVSLRIADFKPPRCRWHGGKGRCHYEAGHSGLCSFE